MDKMYYKKVNRIVDIYKVFDNKTALVFDELIADKQAGNGWAIVKMGQLIPIEYYENHKTAVNTALRKEIKNRLVASQTFWKSTDGKIFFDIEEAILHEKEIMEKENEKS